MSEKIVLIGKINFSTKQDGSAQDGAELGGNVMVGAAVNDPCETRVVPLDTTEDNDTSRGCKNCCWHCWF